MIFVCYISECWSVINLKNCSVLMFLCIETGNKYGLMFLCIETGNKYGSNEFFVLIIYSTGEIW